MKIFIYTIIAALALGGTINAQPKAKTKAKASAPVPALKPLDFNLCNTTVTPPSADFNVLANRLDKLEKQMQSKIDRILRSLEALQKKPSAAPKRTSSSNGWQYDPNTGAYYRYVQQPTTYYYQQPQMFYNNGGGGGGGCSGGG